MKIRILQYKFLKDIHDNDSETEVRLIQRKKKFQLILLISLAVLSLLSLALLRLVPLETNVQGSQNRNASPFLVCYLWSGLPTWQEALRAGVTAGLCSHVLIGFASVSNCTVQVSSDVAAALRDARAHVHPDVKVLLSVGGANTDSEGFSTMVRDHASRKTFIRSVKSILREYSLDGIDLDWEFPGFHGLNFLKTIHSRRERQHFSQLLREIRKEYVRERQDYLLTIAVAAPEIIAMLAYDIDQINMYVDFVNIMTYDFHYHSSYTPFTGFNSPLFARPNEFLYMASLNINYTVNWYISQGLSRDKIVVGIPTYGHSFSLVNPNNHGVGSPTSDYGSLGNFVDYPVLCTYTSNNSEFAMEYDKNALVPYLYSDRLWVSFESPESVTMKAKYVVDQKLRGAMIYSLNSDDYKGECSGHFGNQTSFPLVQTVKNTFITSYEKNIFT